MTTESAKSIDEIKAEVLKFLQEETGFGQVYTINKDGFPIGRTMGAPIEDDWTIDMIQPNHSKRLDQVSKNPRMEVLWIDTSVRIPRAVFLRGNGKVFLGDELLTKYNRRVDISEAKGRSRGPRQEPDAVRANLAGIHFTPVHCRVEGFGERTELFAWDF